MTTTWIEEAELPFDFSDLKGEAYQTLNLDAKTDDSTDDAINAILDVRGLRKLFVDGYLFDPVSSREDYADAVITGVANWWAEEKKNETDPD